VCGVEKVVAARALKNKAMPTRSCGCKRGFLIRLANTKHEGRANYQATPEYGAWATAKKSGMCGSWSKKFTVFLRSVGERPAGAVLVRLNPSKAHGPRNTYWGARQEVARSRAGAKVLVEWEGVTLSAGEWSKRKGWQRNLIARRIRNGWSVERAMTTPPRPPRPKGSRVG